MSWTGTTTSVLMVRQRSTASCSGRDESPIASVEKLASCNCFPYVKRVVLGFFSNIQVESTRSTVQEQQEVAAE